MVQHRSIAYRPVTRDHSGNGVRDHSPPDEDSKSGGGEKKPRKRNSVAVRVKSHKILSLASATMTDIYL